MLEQQMWFRYEEALPIAWRQYLDEGKAVEADYERMKEIAGLPYGDPRKRKLAGVLLDLWEVLPLRKDFPYEEPDALEEILKLTGNGASGEAACAEADGKEQADRAGTCTKGRASAGDIDYDRVYGAWLGRAAGCLLGQPVEGWYQERLLGFLQECGNLPVRGYLSSAVSDEIRQKYEIVDEKEVYGGSRVNWINNVDCMPEDDDTNYTILALKLMEQKGFDFTPEDVGECWLNCLPILHVCTAERVAYINMVNSISPPESAKHRNAYREYIGAQIRGDFFGYVCPGDPRKAAQLAWRDASISHTKNGIYGEMFVAAMLARAAAETDLEKIIKAGLSQIPPKSRLAEAVGNVLSWKKQGTDAETVIRRIRERFDETFGYDWCHVISNAMIVCTGLLYGNGDFTATMDLCLRAAFDTDCNCATAGSVLGMVLGAERLPKEWIMPLQDKIRSGVDGMGLVPISSLARRTVEVYRKNR